MTIPEIAASKGFVVTSELTPPKGANHEKTLELAQGMSQRVDAINVTDGQGAVMRMGALTLSRLLMDKGIEPVLQLTCRDRNRIALQSDLLGASALGIRNVLCLTGDHVALGDHPDARQVFDLDSVSLLWAIRRLNRGSDMRGNRLEGATDLCAGGVVNPNASPVEPQLIKMRRKIEAGARFFQTQAVFETARLEPFMSMAQEMKVPILMGVLFLATPKMARYFRDHVPGIDVPEEVVEEMASTEDPTRAGMGIAARLINQARGLCQGVHLMNVGKEGLVERILDQAGLKG